MAPRVVILDFDGTLVESVNVKDGAFAALFADRPDRLDEIMAYHLANNAVIRFEKFRHITEDILGEPYTPEEERRLCGEFSRLVRDGVVAAPEVPGATELLDALAGRPVYLLSVSPVEELAGILEERGIAGRFRGVYAHPWSKADAIRDILRREGVPASEAVLVGDSPEDLASAREAGAAFLGRDSGKRLPAHEVPVFEDMYGVAEALSGART